MFNEGVGGGGAFDVFFLNKTYKTSAVYVTYIRPVKRSFQRGLTAVGTLPPDYSEWYKIRSLFVCSRGYGIKRMGYRIFGVGTSSTKSVFVGVVVVVVESGIVWGVGGGGGRRSNEHEETPAGSVGLLGVCRVSAAISFLPLLEKKKNPY